jgi:hypothetical protein
MPSFFPTSLFLTKANAGIVSVFLLYVFFAFNVVYQKNLSLRSGLLLGAGHLGSLLLLCGLLNVDVWHYTLSSLHLINGYNDAMYLSLQGPEYMLYTAVGILLLYGALFLAGYRSFRQRAFLLFAYGMVAAVTYVLFKQGFVRADGHYFAFYKFIPLFIGLMALYTQGTLQKTSFGLFVVTLVACGAISTGGKFDTFYNTSGIVHKRYLIPAYFQDLARDTHQEELAALRKERMIPESILRQIGRYSVDVGTSEISYAIVNNLTYNPRPVIQTYTVFDNYLDKKNEAKYKGSTRPDFILLRLETLDERYALFDETFTKLAILQHYEVVDRSWDYLLLKKLPRPLAFKTVEQKHGSAKLDEYIPVGKGSHLQLFKPRIKYNLLGKARRFLYQPPHLYVTLRLESGTTKTYRAITTVVNGGVFINAFVDSNNPMDADLFFTYNGALNQRVTKFKFSSPDSWGFTDEFEYDIEFIAPAAYQKSAPHFAQVQKINPQVIESLPGNVFGDLGGQFADMGAYAEVGGWAAIENQSAENSKTTIVLKSETHVYTSPTQPVKRPDVTAHLKTLNYDDAGYYAFIPKTGLAPGKYQVGFLVEKEGNQSIRFVDKYISHAVETPPVPLPKPLPETHNIHGDLFNPFTDHGDVVELGGWASIEKQDAENTRMSVVLQNAERAYLFLTKPFPRPDVTQYFNNGLNYDKSGFSCQVDKKFLPKGKYQVGLQIVKNDSVSAFSLTQKFVVKE